MKLSQIIKAFENLRTKYGNLDVCVFDPNTMTSGKYEDTPAYITLGSDENGKVIRVTLADSETAQSFI